MFATHSDLNKKYVKEGKGSFFLFHRHLIYNPTEGAWMGWERKRGKLLDLNNLLRNSSDSFPVKIGNLSILHRVRYVITLDTDTQLPKDSASRLVGTLAHPLNRAVINPLTNTVVEGYSILQPRVGINVKSAVRSRLASLFREKLDSISILEQSLMFTKTCLVKVISPARESMKWTLSSKCWDSVFRATHY